MFDPVPTVSRAMSTIQNTHLREKVAAQAVLAYGTWLQTPQGRDSLLKMVFDAGYHVSVRGAQ